MKNALNIILTLLVLIIGVLTINNTGNFNYIHLIAVIILSLIFILLQNININIDALSKKKKLAITAGVLLINVVVQFVLLKKISLYNIFTIGINSLILMITFLLAYRRLDYKNGLLILILSTICSPLFYQGTYSSLFNLLIVLYIYGLTAIEYEYPFGKKNLIKLFIIASTCGAFIHANPIILIPLVLLFLSLFKNVGKKRGLIQLIITGLFATISYFILKIKIFNNLLYMDNTSSLLKVSNNILVLLEVVIYSLILVSIIRTLYLTISKTYENNLLKSNIYYSLVIVLILILGYSYEDNIVGTLTFVSFIYFIFNNYEIKAIPKINYLNRFIKPDEYKKVSVVIPNYNYEEYLSKRIDSVVKQTYPIYELIIIDDKSTDESVKKIKNKIKEVKSKYPDLKVNFIQNKENSGNVFKQWQKAFEESTGDYLWIAEADDLCSKYFLNTVMKGFNDENVVLSYCESALIDEDGKMFSKDTRFDTDVFNTKHFNLDYINDGKKELAEIMCINNTIINASSVIFKKNKNIDVKKYFKDVEKYKLCGDWSFYAKYLLNGSVAYVCDSLNYHRMHSKSVTLKTDSISKLKEIMEVQKEIETYVTISPEILERRATYIKWQKGICNITDNVIKCNGYNDDLVYKPSLLKKLNNKLNMKKIGKKIDIYNMNVSKIHSNKKVSVVIPNYNYENFLEERIDSILRQSFPIYELIILDDCSSDNSLEIINTKMEQIKSEYPNIKTKLIVNKTNGGSVFSQWQKAFKESTGEYVWIAEADDSCNPKFLEKVMKSFDDEEVVLSYAESMRINENNEIIDTDCRSWMTVVSYDRWDHSYIKNGLDEIKESLCICNTIPNVSAVVFKKSNQIEMIENSKKFKISGDWYLYYQILKTGKIAYCKDSLNYFRKHSNSTSTVAKKEIELEELLSIQKEIRSNILIPSDKLCRQRWRYEGILNEVDIKTLLKLKPMMVKKIAWIIPRPIKGSGGIRTMIQNANYLVTKGYEVDIYIEEDFITTNKELKKMINEYYGKCLCNTYVGIEMRKQYDLVFATYSILTADYVSIMDVEKKAYFIQDFEPWFEAMGELYLEMEKSYKYKLEGISIGNWLANKITNEFNSPMHSFPFCADLKIYNRNKSIEKEDAICFIYQPEKSRRCSNLGLRALRIVKLLRPNVKIYLYGSNTGDMSHFGLQNLGIVNIEKCSELYNKCRVGLCISASNPSRIPFEMMACGLPVVDLYRENNLYDIPEDAVLLADATPEGLASALIKILDDEKLQNEMGKKGIEYMKNYSLEKGFEIFGQFVDDYLNDNLDKYDLKGKTYKKGACPISNEVMDVRSIASPMPVPISGYSDKKKKMAKLRMKLIQKYNDFIIKHFMVK